jgi:hypothetical protein
MTHAVTSKFNFKARKITNEEGKEIGKTKKQAPVTVSLPMPSPEELIATLSVADEEVKNDAGEVIGYKVDKVKALLMDAVEGIIRDQARSQFDDIIEGFGNDQEKSVTADMLDMDKLTLEYIANLPPSQRGARAIPEEDWNTFYEDYMQTMVAATGKPEGKIKNQVDIFKRPTRAKSNKEVLALLVTQLDLYMANSANIEETGECAGRLRNKFDKWTKEEDKVNVDAL